MPDNNVVTPLLSVQSLSLARGGRELFGELSFQVEAGQLWQIEGANGAGKTSLLRILCGLSRYGFEGTVSCDVAPLYVGHLAAVKGLLTPRENLALHASGAVSATPAQIGAALRDVGLSGFEDHASHMLSAGQRRRVNLARLLLSQAPVWLLDEPFTALDNEGVEAVQTLLVAHVAAGGAAIVTSHQPLSVQCPVHALKLGTGATA